MDSISESVGSSSFGVDSEKYGKVSLKMRLPALLLLVAGLLVVTAAAASDEHISPQEFLQQVFANAEPDSATVWLTGETQDIATRILGHKPDYLRLRYWYAAGKEAWIVDEIGKTEPITIGIVVEDNAITAIQVLAFRESRGWEIKHDFFTRQFRGVGLDRGLQLDASIDGISGATLSVRAMHNVSRLVLYLSQSLDS